MIRPLPHQKGRDQWGAKSIIHEDRQQSLQPFCQVMYEASVLSTPQRVTLMHPVTFSLFPRAINNSQELLGHNLRRTLQIY